MSKFVSGSETQFTPTMLLPWAAEHGIAGTASPWAGSKASRHEWLHQHIIDTIAEAQDYAT